MKLNAKQLRASKHNPEAQNNVVRNPIYLVIDEVLDTYNIGSLFRLADAVAVEKMYLCGDMEYPPSSRIHKAAVGTEAWVPWEKADSTLEVVQNLKKLGVYTIAVEQDARAISYSSIDCPFPVAIVVGHETKGISKTVLDCVDAIVEFPMYGINKSFNVWGSAAIMCYKVLEKLQK